MARHITLYTSWDAEKQEIRMRESFRAYEEFEVAMREETDAWGDSYRPSKTLYIDTETGVVVADVAQYELSIYGES